MYFNAKFVLILCSVVFVFTGCTDFMHGRAARENVLKAQSIDGSCSVDFKNKIKKISNSESNLNEINEVFGCIDKYMSQFQNKVNGADVDDIYNIQDLMFITNRFFKDLSLSEAIVHKMINFKRVLVGGDSDTLSKNEVNKLRDYFSRVVKQETINLHSYFKFLIADENTIKLTPPELAKKSVVEATNQLRQSLKVLIKNSNLDQIKYNYEEAKELLFGIGLISEGDQKTVADIDTVRRLLIGNQNLNTLDDFFIFIDNIADAYSLYLNSKYGLVKLEMKSVGGVKNAIDFFDRVVNLLSSTYQFKKTERIDTNTLDQVIKLLLDKKVFPFEVQFDTFQDFYKIALRRVFSQETSDFISAKQFDYYYQESQLFKLEIDYIESYIGDKELSLSNIQNSFKKYIESGVYYKKEWHIQNDDNKVHLVNDFISMNYDFYSQHPVLLKNKKYLLTKDIHSVELSAMDLIRGFYIKIFARELLMGWGNGKVITDFKSASLTQEQMSTFSLEFKRIGIELKLNDPRAKNDGVKSFLEANLFGFSSDGNNSMSLAETFEYLHYLISEGAWTVSEIQNDLASAKCELPILDVFGNHWVSESCFIQNLKHNYSKYFSSKPGLVSFISKMSDSSFLKYIKLMLDFSRFDSKNKGIKIETVDIQNFIVLSSYIEAMFVQYDFNNSDTLSANEIRAAYPKFKNFSTDYSQKYSAESLKQWDSSLNYCRMFYTKEDLIKESFIFMVLNQGRIPVTKDMNYITCGVKGIFTFKNEIDRESIINTFFVLKSVLASDK